MMNTSSKLRKHNKSFHTIKKTRNSTPSGSTGVMNSGRLSSRLRGCYPQNWKKQRTKMTEYFVNIARKDSHRPLLKDTYLYVKLSPKTSKIQQKLLKHLRKRLLVVFTSNLRL
jgi:hypothetical protein